MLAGRLQAAGAARAEPLRAALGAAGEGGSMESGPLALAWSGGGRPAESAGAVCVLDGRLANAGELAQSLGLPGSPPPAAVVAIGYERWGRGVLERLSGEFALCLWDRRGQVGLLARDPLGARPLFVAGAGRDVWFASEVRTMLALLPRRPAPDPAAVAAWLARTAAGEGRTLYSGIRRLEPGHALALGQPATAAARYWAPRYAPPRIREREEACRALGHGMAAAVRRALEPGEATGILLSGGFDSASVAALAAGAPASAAGRPVAAYSAVFPDHPEVDESAQIAAVRRAVGLDGVREAVRGGSPLSASLDFLAAWELPSVSPNRFVWAPLIARAAADGFTTLLDGEGGDELFGCSPFLIADRLRRGRPFDAVRLARALPGMGESPRPEWVRRALVRYGLRGAIPRRTHAVLRRLRGRSRPGPPWLTPAVRASLDDDPWAWKRLPGPRWWAAKTAELTVGSEALGAADQLRREAVLGGVRFRHPFRDPELIELALGLAPELAFDARLDRPLARAAMADRLPDAVRLSARKPFFNTLLVSALEAELPGIAGLIGDPQAEIGAYVDKAGVREGLLNAAPERRTVAWPLDLWRLVTLECWLRAQAGPSAVEGLRDRFDRPARSSVSWSF